jgi:hypothetical protein
MTGPGVPPPPYNPPPPPYSVPPPPPYAAPPPPPGGYYGGFNPQPTKAKANSGVIIAVFVGVLLAVGLIVGVAVLLNQPLPPVTPCDQGEICGSPPTARPISNATPLPGSTTAPRTAGATGGPGVTIAPQPTPAPTGPAASPGVPTPTPAPTPVSNADAVTLGGTWTSSTFGVGFEFNPDYFTMGNNGADFAILRDNFFDGSVVVKATSAETTPAEFIDQQVAVLDTVMVARTGDTDDYDAVLGPSIGYVNGEARVFSGILLGPDGTPTAPGGATIVSATNGQVTVAVIVIVAQPDLLFGIDSVQHLVRSTADDVLKTFTWSTP